MAHLMAIQTGTGESFYSGTVRVVTSQQKVSVQHSKKLYLVAQEKTVPSDYLWKKNERTNSAYALEQQKNAYCITRQQGVFVLVKSTVEVINMSALDSLVKQ